MRMTALDCIDPCDAAPIPAISLSLEAANITALANDVGTELIFLRQLIAQARPGDVAVAIFNQWRLEEHHRGA